MKMMLPALSIFACTFASVQGCKSTASHSSDLQSSTSEALELWERYRDIQNPLVEGYSFNQASIANITCAVRKGGSYTLESGSVMFFDVEQMEQAANEVKNGNDKISVGNRPMKVHGWWHSDQIPALGILLKTQPNDDLTGDFNLEIRTQPFLIYGLAKDYLKQYRQDKTYTFSIDHPIVAMDGAHPVYQVKKTDDGIIIVKGRISVSEPYQFTEIQKVCRI